MFPKENNFVTQYNQQMKEIKAMNRQQIISDYMTRLNLYLADQNQLTQPIDSGFIDIEIDVTKKDYGKLKNPMDLERRENPNYFSEDRIAVYTAIFGPYDRLIEPVTAPDNVDFFIFTDQEVAEDSVWQKMDIDLNQFSEYELDTISESGKLKNRFVKMHPRLFFDEYKYAMYVDGNIKVMTDVTEFLERVNEYGIVAHNHYRSGCAYVETQRCLDQNLITEEVYEEHVRYLNEEGLPEKYGLDECGVLLFEVHNEIAKTILEEWWQSFLQGAKRDQIHLPVVLHRHGIRPADISGLGNDMYSNYAFQKVNHAMNREEYSEYIAEIST